MGLTAIQVTNAKPAAKPYKLADGGGLHLYVAPTGFKSWRYRYQENGREQLIVLGNAKDVTLAQARRQRDAVRHKRNTIDKTAPKLPSEPLRSVALRYVAHKGTFWLPKHRLLIERRLERDVFPALGDVPVRDITAAQILAVLRTIQPQNGSDKTEGGSVELAYRMQALLVNVFGFAIGESLLENNPAVGARASLMALKPSDHRPAVDNIKDARDVLRRVESIPAPPMARLCMRFLALTAQRPGECAGAAWSELKNDDERYGWLWVIPQGRMKMKRRHTVPLSRQALAVIEAARVYSSRLPNIFPAIQNEQRALWPGVLREMLERAGMKGKHVPHGWRATFSTIMNGEFPNDRLVIDLMLAHTSKDAVEAAYNRQPHQERRGELAQIWADLLLEGAPSAMELLELSLVGETELV